MAAKQVQQMTVSDFNLEKLSTKELSRHVSGSIAAGANIAIFGQRGSGKTEICKAAIEECGAIEAYINLSVLERVDLGGYPDVMGTLTREGVINASDSRAVKNEKFIEYLLPKFYHDMLHGDRPVVVLFDELDKADPSIWAPLLEFIQFRSINGRPLKNLRSVVMTGNLISEGGSRPSLPLLDRAEKYLITTDAKQWIEWSGNKGKIHPSIISFIHYNPQELHGSVDPDDRYADPSPRSWTNASRLIYFGESQGWDSDMINQKVAGCVGKTASIKFSNYYQYYSNIIPLIDELFAGKNIMGKYEKLEQDKRLVACMMAGARLSSDLKENKKDRAAKSTACVGKFLSNVVPENAFIVAQGQIGMDQIAKSGLLHHSDWTDLFKKLSLLMSND